MPDSTIIGQYNPVYPFSTVGLTNSTILCNGNFKSGSSFLISTYVALTAAHNITCRNEIDLGPIFQPGLLTSGGNYFPPFGFFITHDVKIYQNYDPFDSNFKKATPLQSHLKLLIACQSAANLTQNYTAVKVDIVYN